MGSAQVSIPGSPRWRYTILLVPFLAGCGSQWLPLAGAPSELASGVAIYQHKDYGGESGLLTASVADLGYVRGPCGQGGVDSTTYPTEAWDNCVSSVKVAAGWRAILYLDGNYRGQRFEIVADVPNLELVPGPCSHGLNDCITSIEVVAPR